MPILFTCPHCGKRTEVADQYAGQSGPCAGCGKMITIPGGFVPGPAKSEFGERPSPGPRAKSSNTWLILAVALAVFCVCGGGIMTALLLPAVQAAREAARRMQCSNNLKQIALAIHNYHDVHKCLPAAFVADKNGQPMHSWRVALLPFLESQALYQQYNFDEPWDSPNNLLVADQMPQVFHCPTCPTSVPNSNLSNYVVVIGDKAKQVPETLFAGNRWLRFRDVLDGTSNTLMIVEVKDPVPWTQPDDDLKFDTMNFQINGGADSIGSYHPRGANAAFADGAVRFLDDSTDSQLIRLMIQPADGQAIRVP